jgi:hypothetical protein
MMTISPAIYSKQRLVNSGNTVTILTDATTSSALFCNGASILAMITDAVLAAANFTFQVSPDGENFYQLMDPNTTTDAYTIGVSANSHIPLDTTVFAGVQYVKVVSSAAPEADSTITFVMGPLWQ